MSYQVSHLPHRVVLVRHGRTAYNAQGRLQGQIDIPLDDTGLWQAQCTAKALQDAYASHGNERLKIVASDLERARITAEQFATLVGEPVQVDERVRERSFGVLEGAYIRELPMLAPDVEYWNYGEKYQAETKEVVGMRGAKAIESLVRESPNVDTIVAFTHGAFIAQTLQTMLHAHSPHRDEIIPPTHAHWSALEPYIKSDETIAWRLVSFNVGPLEARTPQWGNPSLI